MNDDLSSCGDVSGVFQQHPGEVNPWDHRAEASNSASRGRSESILVVDAGPVDFDECAISSEIVGGHLDHTSVNRFA
jgi:hypothetical protein